MTAAKPTKADILKLVFAHCPRCGTRGRILDYSEEGEIIKLECATGNHFRKLNIPATATA
jgi:hypothetical protein